MTNQQKFVYLIHDNENKTENDAYNRVFMYDIENDDLQSSGIFYGTLFDNVRLIPNLYVIDEHTHDMICEFEYSIQLIESEFDVTETYYYETKFHIINGLIALTQNIVEKCKNENTDFIYYNGK